MIVIHQQQVNGSIPKVGKDLYDILQEMSSPYLGIKYQWDGHGNPGWDCSEWVRYVYDECFGIDIPGYTDSIFYDEDLAAIYPYEAKIGDIVLYQYHDPGQPRTMFPHVGIWIDEHTVLDSRWPDGVNFHKHLNNARMVIMRKKEK